MFEYKQARRTYSLFHSLLLHNFYGFQFPFYCLKYVPYVRTHSPAYPQITFVFRIYIWRRSFFFSLSFILPVACSIFYFNLYLVTPIPIWMFFGKGNVVGESFNVKLVSQIVFICTCMCSAYTCILCVRVCVLTIVIENCSPKWKSVCRKC